MLTISLLLLAVPAHAEVLQGHATVVDGDTLRVAGQAVRIHGIDTPERGQTCETAQGVAFACGEVATAAMTALIGTRPVRCEGNTRDRHQRIVAKCFVGRQDLGAALVTSGYAVAYQRYSLDYVPNERAARGAERGFWSGRMQQPEAYRARDVDPSADRSCALKGNISSSGRIVHSPGDESYAKTRINTARGERWFCSLDEAIAAGWRPARR